MITPSEHRRAADALLNAQATRTPIAPLSETYPGLEISDAYEIQSLVIADQLAQGRVVRGYKVGLTSLAMQRQLGVDQPDSGLLLDDMYIEEGATVAASTYLSPKVEPEIAVVLRSPLKGPGVTVDDVAAATESLVGSIEVIDSRIRDWRITITDTIADNASSGGVVVGRTELALDAVDRLGLEVTVSINGEPAGSGTGADVLGDPLAAVAWLANTMGEQGLELPAGALVIPGSVCAAAAVRPGDHVVADFGPLGTVSVTFEGEADNG